MIYATMDFLMARWAELDSTRDQLVLLVGQHPVAAFVVPSFLSVLLLAREKGI